MSDNPTSGVLFPLVDGRRSTQTTSRAVFAEAVRSVAPDVAVRIETSADWHKDYVRHLGDLERVSASSGKAASLVAADGLLALHERMVFARELTAAVWDGEAVGPGGIPSHRRRLPTP